MQHHSDLFHNFLDFKNTFHKVYHEVLWQVLRNLNIEEELVQAIQALYEHCNSLEQSARGVLQDNSRVRQGCLLLAILFILVLEEFMQETLHDHHTSISTGGRPIFNLRFADIDLADNSSGELQDLTN